MVNEKARRARGRLRVVMSAVLLLTAIFMFALSFDLDALVEPLWPILMLGWAVLIALAVYTAWRIPEAMDSESNTGRGDGDGGG